MNIEELNKQVEEEIKNNKTNKQFLMIKDIYCSEGLNLTPSLACFYSFLVFMSDRFLHNNKGIKSYIGYSNKSLAKIYSLKWFNISERTIVQYLAELKKKNLISIENNGKANRKIYINYSKIRPELLNLVDDSVVEEYKIKIETLTKELEEVNKQNEILLSQVINQNTTTEEMALGMFTKVLFNKKYLSEKDNLVKSQLEDYNAMLKSFLFLYQREGLDFFKSLNYICKNTNSKKIKDKFSYLYISLNNYLNKIKNTPSELWPSDDE